MNDLMITAMVCIPFALGWFAGFAAGVWKAAKMQALREAQQALQSRAESDAERSVRIARLVSPHIEPTKPWPRK